MEIDVEHKSRVRALMAVVRIGSPTENPDGKKCVVANRLVSLRLYSAPPAVGDVGFLSRRQPMLFMSPRPVHTVGWFCRPARVDAPADNGGVNPVDAGYRLFASRRLPGTAISRPSPNAGDFARRIGGNGHHAQVIATGLDESAEHVIEIEPVLEPGEELRLESICAAGPGAAVRSMGEP